VLHRIQPSKGILFLHVVSRFCFWKYMPDPTIVCQIVTIVFLIQVVFKYQEPVVDTAISSFYACIQFCLDSSTWSLSLLCWFLKMENYIMFIRWELLVRLWIMSVLACFLKVLSIFSITAYTQNKLNTFC
jgi:hypothetical protein